MQMQEKLKQIQQRVEGMEPEACVYVGYESDIGWVAYVGWPASDDTVYEAETPEEAVDDLFDEIEEMHEKRKKATAQN